MLFIFRKATDFCVLILYLTTLLNVFIGCLEFSNRVFRVFEHRIISFANNDILTYLFPSVSAFLVLNDLAKTSSTEFNRMGRRDTFVLFLIIVEML